MLQRDRETAGAGRQDADDIFEGGQSDSAASGRVIEMKIKSKGRLGRPSPGRRKAWEGAGGAVWHWIMKHWQSSRVPSYSGHGGEPPSDIRIRQRLARGSAESEVSSCSRAHGRRAREGGGTQEQP